MIVNVRELKVKEDRVKKSDMNAIRISKRYNKKEKCVNLEVRMLKIYQIC